MKEKFAYLAGVMDSDGSFMIKKSTYGIRRRRDCKNPIYSEWISIKQTSPDAVQLMKGLFGGSLVSSKVYCKNGKPFWVYHAMNRVAHRICQSLYPYLRIKKEQCGLLLELRNLKGCARSACVQWWVQEHPSWGEMPMLTTSEVRRILGYSSNLGVRQALDNGILVALPHRHGGPKEIPRFPAPLIYELAKWKEDSGSFTATPPPLLAKYEELYQSVKKLNSIGNGNHPITLRCGPYKPIGRDS